MKNNLLIIISFVILLFSSCDRESSNRASVVNKLKSSAKLSTVEYVVTKVISAEKKFFLGKDAYFFAETEATIKAGIDMNKLRIEDVVIDGKIIKVILPPIELINFSYPADAFKIIESYTYGNSLLKWRSFNIEQRDELYRQGELDIRNNIKNLGITKTAEKNTITLLKPVLKAAGFDEVYIEFSERDDELNQEEELKTLKEEMEKLKSKKKS